MDGNAGGDCLAPEALTPSADGGPRPTKALEIIGLTKRYGPTVGVEALDFSVRRGEVFGYLGPNGSGKTTTIRCILGLIRPTSGQVRIYGEEVRLGQATQHGRIGYLPGDFRIWPDLTARRALAVLARLGGDGSAATRREELAERLELPLDRRVRALSKGNRQKVGVLSAFQHSPDLLILDEPTGGLDPLARQAVWDLIREAAEGGATILLSSHDLAEVSAVCERVAILREGRMVELAPISRIIEQGEHELKVWFPEGVEVPVPPAGRLSRARVVRREPRSLHLAYRGRADEVLDWISEHPVERISTPEIPLERAFVRLLRSESAAPVETDRDVQRPPETTPSPKAPRPPFPFALLRFWARRLFPGWGLIALTIFLIQIAVCGTAHDNEAIKAMLAFLDYMPNFVKTMLGGEGLQLGNIAGLLAIGYKHPLVLILFMVFAVAAPTALLSGETQRGTMELISSRAATKTQIYICAAAPTVIGMFLLSLGMYMGTVAGTTIYEFDQPVPLDGLFRLQINAAVLSATVGAIALLAAAVFPQRNTAIGACVAYLVMNYIVAVFPDLWPVMEPLGPLSLFEYVGDPRIFTEQAWPVAGMSVLGVVLTTALVVGWVVWTRRDLQV